MKSIVYNTIDDNIYLAWEHLWQTSPHATYSNSPYWFNTVVKHFDYKRYAIIAVYDNEMLVAVAALMRVKKYGSKVYTLAPNDFVCGLPFLFDPSRKSVVKEIHKQLLTLGHVYLDNVPLEFVECFQTVSKYMQAYPFTVNYYRELIPNEQGIIAFSYRKKIFRHIREKRESFFLKGFDGTDKDILPVIFTIDAASSKRVSGYNCFSTRFIKKFYGNLIREFGKKFKIYILYFDGKPIAYEMGFLINDVFYDNQAAYKVRYQSYNPGNVLSCLIMDHLAREGVKIVDFGSGDTFQKKLISQDKNDLYKVIFSKNSFIRFHYCNLDKVKEGLYGQLQKKRTMYSLYRKIKKSRLKQDL